MEPPQDTFTLWNAAFDEDMSGCRFDVRPNALIQLDRGTEPLINGFLQCLGIDKKAGHHEVKRFCSPYFSGSAPAMNHTDRFPLAWRVHVHWSTAVARKFSPLPLLGPRVCGGFDVTWQESDDSWNWSSGNCWVIADVLVRSLQSFELLVGSSAALQLFSDKEVVQIGPAMMQFRFDLGLLNFPQDEAKVREIMALLRLQGQVSLNWATSMRMELENR